MIGTDGTLYIAGLFLYAFDPIQQKIKWGYPAGGNSDIAPTVTEQGKLLWTVGPVIDAIKLDGSLAWIAGLGANWANFSKAAIGQDENIYVAHDGLFSFQSELSGDETDHFRWLLYYSQGPNVGGIGDISPAIAPDGTIYVATGEGLLAVQPNGEEKWTAGNSDYGATTPMIGKNGDIYVSTYHIVNEVHAYSSNGIFRWKYNLGSDINWYSKAGGMAVADDGTLIILRPTKNYEQGTLHAINPDGTLKWKKTIPGSGVPIMDRLNNIYFCIGEYCRAYNNKGELIWQYWIGENDRAQYSYPPVIGGDGLIYFLVYRVNPMETSLIAIYDPTVLPRIRTVTKQMAYRIKTGTKIEPSIIKVNSTSTPIEWSGRLEPPINEWVSISPSSGQTPSDLTVSFSTETLSPGSYSTKLILYPKNVAGIQVEIPINIKVYDEEFGIFLPSVRR